MPGMHFRKDAVMTQHARNGQVVDPPRDDPHDPAAVDDRSWHNSSFELAQGLEVVEIRIDFQSLIAAAAGELQAARA
jgi:hypothetical protein